MMTKPAKKINSSFEERVNELGQYLILFRTIQNQSDAKFLHSLGGLSMQELNVLNIIGDGKLTIMSEIAKRASLSLSSVTVIVEKLVKAKLVERIRSEEDRRIVKGVLTAEGNKIYQLQIKHMHSVLHNVLNTLSSKEQVVFLELFKKITMALL